MPPAAAGGRWRSPPPPRSAPGFPGLRRAACQRRCAPFSLGGWPPERRPSHRHFSREFRQLPAACHGAGYLPRQPDRGQKLRQQSAFPESGNHRPRSRASPFPAAGLETCPPAELVWVRGEEAALAAERGGAQRSAVRRDWEMAAQGVATVRRSRVRSAGRGREGPRRRLS